MIYCIPVIDVTWSILHTEYVYSRSFVWPQPCFRDHNFYDIIGSVIMMLDQLWSHLHCCLGHVYKQGASEYKVTISSVDGSPCPLQWRHNWRDGVSNNQGLDSLLNRLFKRRSNKTTKLRVTGLCEGNSPVTGEVPSQRASNAENVSIWWHHHEKIPYLERRSLYWKRAQASTGLYQFIHYPLAARYLHHRL